MTSKRTRHAILGAAACLLIAPHPARACGDLGPAVWLFPPALLVAAPVVVGGVAGGAAVGSVLGAGAFVGTLPMRVYDNERANEITRDAFMAPFEIFD